MHRDLVGIITGMIVCGTGLGALSIALWGAEQIVLRRVYGAERIERDQLRVVGVKPGLVVSNGDRLESWSFPHFLITCLIWLPLCHVLMFAARAMLPKTYRWKHLSYPFESFKEDGFSLALTAATLLLMFLCLVLMHAVGMALTAGVFLCIATLTAWTVPDGL